MKYADIAISAVTASGITAGSVLLGALLTNSKMPSGVVWLAAGVTGLVAAFKDIRSSLRLPPVDGEIKQPEK